MADVCPMSGAGGASAGAAATDDAVLRGAALGLRRACSGCSQVFAELEEILCRRVGRDPAWAPRAWEAARLGLVDPRRVLGRAYTAVAREMRHLCKLDSVRQ